MTTAIRGCNNQSDTHVSIVNREHPADSRVVPPKSYSDVYAWIPQHKAKSLSVQTVRGHCIIWDESWKIRIQWDGSSEGVLAVVQKEPQDYEMTVSPGGDISLAKL